MDVWTGLDWTSGVMLFGKNGCGDKMFGEFLEFFVGRNGHVGMEKSQ